KPLWGHRSMIGAAVFLGFMSFVVWAHHMFLTGMGSVISAFFQTTTMIISIPSVIILTALFISLWGASIRFTTPMLFALAFLSMSAVGLLICQVPFIVNFFWNAFQGMLGHKNVDDNPWQATTVDWAATTSPPLGHGNFTVMPVIYRGPYEYNCAECTTTDFVPQHIELPAPPVPGGGMLPEAAVAQREM